MTDEYKRAMLTDLEDARKCLEWATDQVNADSPKSALQWLALVAQYVSLATDKLPRDTPGVEHMISVWDHANKATRASFGQEVK